MKGKSGELYVGTVDTDPAERGGAFLKASTGAAENGGADLLGRAASVEIGTAQGGGVFLSAPAGAAVGGAAKILARTESVETGTAQGGGAVSGVPAAISRRRSMGYTAPQTVHFPLLPPA